MKLKKTLPAGRTLDQVKNHYLVEKYISDKLRSADFNERKQIYGNMYDELFSAVPDHPRLVRRQSEEQTKTRNKNKIRLINSFLSPHVTFLEFAPGDCRFAIDEVSKHVNYVMGVDISDQTSHTQHRPDNFELIIYDGYNLDQVKNNSVDIVFSDQLIEHFHPEETELHFKIVHRILKPHGLYVFRTPHELTGPHDVSMYFSDKPECFHLKEWNYIEMKSLVKDIGYSKFVSYWSARSLKVRLPYFYFHAAEKFFGSLPKSKIRKITQVFLPSLFAVAVK